MTLTTNYQKKPMFQEMLLATKNPIKSLQYYYRPVFGRVKRLVTWHVTKNGNTIIVVTDDNVTLILTPEYYWTIKYELSLWPNQYIPYDISDKVILDIGSGQGETNYVFDKYGAKRVIGIEKNNFSSQLHNINARNNGWNVRLINSWFTIDHLDFYHFDLCKIDIEGAESELLRLPKIDFDIIIETHSKDITIKLMDKFNLKVKSEHPLYEQYIIGNV